MNKPIVIKPSKGKPYVHVEITETYCVNSSPTWGAPLSLNVGTGKEDQLRVKADHVPTLIAILQNAPKFLAAIGDWSVERDSAMLEAWEAQLTVDANAAKAKAMLADEDDDFVIDAVVADVETFQHNGLIGQPMVNSEGKPTTGKRNGRAWQIIDNKKGIAQYV